MNLVESVFDIAQSFMNNPTRVFINPTMLNRTVEKLSWIPDKRNEIIYPSFSDVFKLLTISSINYCYWYGKSNIRPLGSSSSKLGEIINNLEFKYPSIFREQVVDALIENRFPLLKERMDHVMQVASKRGEYFVEEVLKEGPDIEIHLLLEQMLKNFPGFAEDLFLKRASLFFILMNRFYGWYEEAMNILPVPADYQVPKALRCEGIITYCVDLREDIKRNKIIQKGSIEECEIRAATIVACKILVKKSGKNINVVDNYFWSKRKEYPDPFHLTITTDY